MDWICMRVCYIECNPTVYIVVFSKRAQFFFFSFWFYLYVRLQQSIEHRNSPIDLDLC